MDKKFSISIPIRSFETDGDAYRILAERYNIFFINTTGKRIEGESLCKALTHADGVIAGTEHYSRGILEACPQLKVISRVGVGTDNVDVQRAKELGIAINNTPDSPVPAVAEHTLALILSAIKKIPEYNEQIRKGNFLISPGSMLAGKKVGIIGMGRVGKRVGALLNCLGCKVIYYDPWCIDDLPEGLVKMSRLQDLLTDSDIITIHAAPLDKQKPILDRDTFNLCKQGVIVINTARASLIDEDALIGAIEKGQISSACLDVQSREPYEGPLLRYPNVIITPHVASNTLESRRQMEMDAVKNLIDSLEAWIQ